MKKIFISILLMLTTNLLALENEKSISKEQQEFFEKEIVSQLKTHGDCKVYNICDGEKKADILFKLKDVILVPNSNKIKFILLHMLQIVTVALLVVLQQIYFYMKK